MFQPDKPFLIAELMERSGVRFGTSGARGLASEMTDALSYGYCLGFLQYLQAGARLRRGDALGVAGDLRPSTPRIAAAACAAARDMGLKPAFYGTVPTPALANLGLRLGVPTIMVTGSHIPGNRNGIKFYTAEGEILKDDEAGILGQRVALPNGRFDQRSGRLVGANKELPIADEGALRLYLRRYLDFFPRGYLQGKRIGLYEHSTVAREPFYRVLSALGAEVVRLGRAQRFVPVDTEAIRAEDEELALDWASAGRFDCLVSADGDGDRPLVSDETGRWLRGDLLGVLTARHLGADTVATPVSSSTVVEKCGWFRRVVRTRIGSPYVIEAMHEATDSGASPVAGYEANGGFLLASEVRFGDRCLAPLPTRDALIVALSVLGLAGGGGKPVSALAADLPARFTDSGRLTDFPTEISERRIAALADGDQGRDRAGVQAVLGADFGEVASLDLTDGLRISFASGEILHLRPSGNAPELRAYTEADTPQRAREMTAIALRLLESWRE